LRRIAEVKLTHPGLYYAAAFAPARVLV
jgi:hypothetical protein